MGMARLSENYSVCLKDDGTPREISRHGEVVTYKAIGFESGRAVSLQLIPLTSIDPTVRNRFEEQARTVQKIDHPNVAKVFDVGLRDEHIVFASEYLQGETTEVWVVGHGPMPADAVVRIGMQVVSALAAAAFHSLTHRSIQPSNILLVPGVAPDGGWPFVKLLNFGLAGLKLYSERSESSELAPSIAPQFASPEQLESGTVDFRSEIFSLGATMCFLLTGAVPLATSSGSSERVLPPGPSIPRSVRRLLSRMLRNNPAERPQDPVVFMEELRGCLQKVERRTAFTRRFGISDAVENRGPDEGDEKTGVRSAVVMALAAVALVLALLAGLLLPERLRAFAHRNRSIESIGVPIGVPETQPSAVEQTNGSPNSSVGLSTGSQVSPAPAMVVEAKQSGTALSPAIPLASPIAATKPAAPTIGKASPATSTLENPVRTADSGRSLTNIAAPRPSASETADSSNSAPAPNGASSAAPQVAANNRMAEPPPPAEGPGATQPQQAPAPISQASPLVSELQNTPAALAAQGRGDASPSAKKSARTNVASKNTDDGKSREARRHKLASAEERSLPPLRVGSVRAQFVGTTDDGNWILQLPSGSTVVTPPVPDVSQAPTISRRKVRRVRIEPQAIPPDQRPPVIVLPPDSD